MPNRAFGPAVPPAFNIKEPPSPVINLPFFSPQVEEEEGWGGSVRGTPSFDGASDTPSERGGQASDEENLAVRFLLAMTINVIVQCW